MKQAPRLPGEEPGSKPAQDRRRESGDVRPRSSGRSQALLEVGGSHRLLEVGDAAIDQDKILTFPDGDPVKLTQQRDEHALRWLVLILTVLGAIIWTVVLLRH